MKTHALCLITCGLHFISIGHMGYGSGQKAGKHWSSQCILMCPCIQRTVNECFLLQIGQSTLFNLGMSRSGVLCPWSDQSNLLNINIYIYIYILRMWIGTGFTIQFDYDYHVNDSIRCHDASWLYHIYFVLLYISRLLFKIIMLIN